MISSPSIPATSPITPASFHLFFWTVYDSAIRTDLTSTALRTSQGWWIIDPTSIPEKNLEDLIGKDSVLGILLTNENHERASEDLRQKKGWPIHAHPTAAAKLELQPDRLFQDGEKLNGGVQAAHIPGASLGETAFYHAPSRSLIVGDALIHLKESGFDFLPDRYCHDPVQAKKSVQLLARFDFEVLAFAHGPPLAKNAKEQFQKLMHRP